MTMTGVKSINPIDVGMILRIFSYIGSRISAINFGRIWIHTKTLIHDRITSTIIII